MSGRAQDRGGLSPSARALLEAARDVDAPTRADRERVRRAVAVAVAGSAGAAGVASAATSAKAVVGSGAGAATAVGTGVATTAASGAVAGVGASLFAKLTIAAMVVGVGSTAVVAVHHYATLRPEPASVESVEPSGDRDGVSAHGSAPAPRIASAPHVAPALPAGPAADAVPTIAVQAAAEPIADAPAPAHVPAARPATRRARPAAPAAADDVSTLDAETLVLRDASRHDTTPARRLASVDAHAAQFPDGVLAGERERARRAATRDLCAEGDDAVTQYLEAHPASSSAALLRATCASR